MLEKANLIYFDDWVHPAGNVIRDSKRIDVHHIDGKLPAEKILPELAWAHGMQAQNRTDATRNGTGERWLAGAQVIAESPSLLAISVAGAGYDVVDVDAATERGIIVCNQSGAGREAVAEHSLGFMLALSKKIALADHVIRRTNDWDRPQFKGNDMYGKTLGIIGFGQIGGRLAELCAPFKMTILACDPYLTAEQCTARGGEKVEIDELLTRSDFVSLNSPLTSDTKGSFGKAQFEAMKPGAYFLTTARGGVHSEAALADALASGHLGGAGLDVFEQEPPPCDHPLLQFDNVVATPHSAGVTEETTRDISLATAEQWEIIFAGDVPPRLINPAAWPLYSKRFEQTFGFAPKPL